MQKGKKIFKKRVIDLPIILILVLFLMGFASAVTAGTCGIVARTACDNTATNGYVVMGLSGTTNSHGEKAVDGTYSNVLCCNFGDGVGAGECSGTNKIIGLSSATNAHTEIPDAGTPQYILNDVCYEDLVCKSYDTSSCPPNYPMPIFSLSSLTNAHIGAFNDYATKICCESASACPDCLGCELTSAKWSIDRITTISAVTSVMEGTNVYLIVKGTEACDSELYPNGLYVDFEVREDDGLLGNYPVTNNPQSVQFITQSDNSEMAIGTWNAEWVYDGLLQGNPEYYFKASVQRSTPLIEITSADPKIEVTELDCPITTQSCSDYTPDRYTGAECNSDVCGKAAASNHRPGTGPEEINCADPTIKCICKYDETTDDGDGVYEAGECWFGTELVPEPDTRCFDEIIQRPNDQAQTEQCEFVLDANGIPTGAPVFFSSDPKESTCVGIGDVSLWGINTFIGGELSCGDTCTFDTSACIPTPDTGKTCGDGLISYPNDDGLYEVCDGRNLAGRGCEGEGLEEPSTLTTGTDTDNDGDIDTALKCYAAGTGDLSNPADGKLEDCQLDKSGCRIPGPEPTHTTCSGGTCVEVPGDGVSECIPVAGSCSPVPDPKHAVCVGQMCMLASGSGTNECTDSDDCETPPSEDYCGDGKVASGLLRLGKYEQCDPSDILADSDTGGCIIDPETNRCFNGPDKYRTNLGTNPSLFCKKLTDVLGMDTYTGGTLFCNSDCTFDTFECISSTLTCETDENCPSGYVCNNARQCAKCGDGVVNLDGEYCDSALVDGRIEYDLRGATCESIGFTGGTLGCYGEEGLDACDFDTSRCAAPEQRTLGTCVYDITKDDDCSDDYLTYSWTAVWEGQGAQPIWCAGSEAPVTRICPAQIKLPFFSTLSLVIAIMIIALFYTISAVSKGRRGNNIDKY